MLSFKLVVIQDYQLEDYKDKKNNSLLVNISYQSSPQARVDTHLQEVAVNLS